MIKAVKNENAAFFNNFRLYLIVFNFSFFKNDSYDFHALFCDYDKAIETKIVTNTTIDSIYILTSEIWTTIENNFYTAVIDSWTYEYAIAKILNYKILNYSNITQERFASIFEMLKIVHDKKIENEVFVDLISKLFVWKPQNRWSIAQIFEHVCWLFISREKHRKIDEFTKKKKNKRFLMNNSRTDLHIK